MTQKKTPAASSKATSAKTSTASSTSKATSTPTGGDASLVTCPVCAYQFKPGDPRL